ncbi:MAG: O-antigen ligase family protein [Planctomycetes bacterium]|nr:O-antigen ligase family protein [Planctomycetota bacterium]
MQQSDSLELVAQPDESRASFVLLSFLIVVFATAFFVNEVDWDASTYDNYAASPDDAEDQVALGKSSRKISYFAIGILGALLFVLPSRQQISFFNLPVALLCLYFLFCLASFIWTDAAWLTTKRMVIAIFGVLAIVGTAKHLSTRDIIDASLGIGTILLAISLCVELSLGTFAPQSNEYRFAGVVHPNTQGGACGLMVIAAFFGMKASHRGKLIYLGFLLLAGLFMIMTKSRTSVAACLCGVSAAWYLVAPRDKQTLVGLGLPVAVCSGLAALLLFGAELTSSATAAAQFGRGAEADLLTLNGRIPLWTSLLEHVAERPMLGFGYQGFWTPDRIYEVSLEQEWTVPSAHSVFLDVLLSTGLVGATIFGLGTIVAFRRITQHCLQTADPTDGFVFAAFVYAMIGGIFESGFSQPNGFEPFITGVALIHVMSRRTRTELAGVVPTHETDPLSNWAAVAAGGLAQCESP